MNGQRAARRTVPLAAKARRTVPPAAKARRTVPLAPWPLAVRFAGVVMEEYGKFADLYDVFMEEIPYEDWCAVLEGQLADFGIRDGLVLELGCGTGNVCEILARDGYDMTGIDVSTDMLGVAEEKRMESGLPILYLCQDMREFELYGTMRAVISVCDSMNYLTDRGDFVRTLKLVNNYLDPGGVFIFDLKTPFFYREVLGSRTMGAAEEDAAYIWENSYEEDSGINEYRMTFFEKQENGSYDRFEELHVQRAWTMEEIAAMAEDAGMTLVRFLKAYTGEDAGPEDERIQVILREKGKNVREVLTDE